jgi:hypothetical protein
MKKTWALVVGNVADGLKLYGPTDLDNTALEQRIEGECGDSTFVYIELRPTLPNERD